jgi:hypothetical protein
VPDLPRRLRDVTPEWLSEALRATGSLGNSRVVAVEPELIGRFSNEVWRLRVRYESDTAPAPATLIAKRPRPDAAIDRLDEFEIRFYRELSALCPVRTPRFHYGDRDRDSGRAALIVEIGQKFLSQGAPSSLHMVAERCLNAAVDLETHDLLD